MLDTIPIPTAVVASFLAIALTAVVAARFRLGARADWVEVVRSVTLPIVDAYIERRVGGVGSVYQLGEREHVGTVDAPPEEVERWLWNGGCRRNVMAAYKTLEDGRDEVGSWVYRGEEIPDREQVHVMLFAGADGGTDVYAHQEFSSALRWLRDDPDVLRKHYAGAYYAPEDGAAFVRRRLIIHSWRE